jgi:hypothetical protein
MLSVEEGKYKHADHSTCALDIHVFTIQQADLSLYRITEQTVLRVVV